MSNVTAVTVIYSVADDMHRNLKREPGAHVRLNEFLEGYGHGPGVLASVEDQYGGSKHPQCIVLGAGVNYLRELEDFVTYFQSLPWSLPENALLILQPEDGPTRVCRADIQTSAAHQLR